MDQRATRMLLSRLHYLMAFGAFLYEMLISILEVIQRWLLASLLMLKVWKNDIRFISECVTG